MDTSENLKKGDYYFNIKDYDNAFKYYHMAHMAKEFKGTFMLAECFRIAFFQANKSKLYCTNNVKYAMDASDLYLTVYRFTNRKDVLAKQLYMDYHIYLSFGGRIVQNDFINYLKEETWGNDPYSKFLKALIQENSNAELLSISHNNDIDVEMRILACFAICRNLIFYQSSKEAISVVEKKLNLALIENSQAQDTYAYIIALMKEANALGAKLNLSATVSELKNLFSYYDEQDSMFYDDMNLSETYYITINYWYKNPSDMIVYKQIKNILKSNGFIFDGSSDVKDGEYRGKNMDFIYEEVL